MGIVGYSDFWSVLVVLVLFVGIVLSVFWCLVMVLIRVGFWCLFERLVVLL